MLRVGSLRMNGENGGLTQRCAHRSTQAKTGLEWAIPKIPKMELYDAGTGT